MFNTFSKFGILITILLLQYNFVFSQNKFEDQLQIVGGKAIKIEQAPWQVALFRYDDQEQRISTQFCGGTIIDEYWIISAAHCLEGVDAEQMRVVASTSTLTGAAMNGQIMEIAQIIVHENYESDPINNDIALIRLQNPIDLSTPKAKSVPMITKNDENNGLTNPGISGLISGWGTLTYQGNAPDSLQAVEIPIIHNDTANTWFKESIEQGEIGNWVVNETMIAMGLEKGGISGCHGDSGGPFVVKNGDNEWALAGITSWGNICGGAKQASVYTRVAFYEQWIAEHTELDKAPVFDDFVEIIKYDGDTIVASCEGNLEFGKLLVRNFGKNPLSKFDIHIQIKNNGQELIYDKSYTYNFSESVPSGGSRRIDFLDTNLTELGKYSMTIIVDKPNGIDVIGLTPSLVSIDFELVEATIINLQVKVNKTSDYTFWAIYNAENFEAIDQVSYSTNDIGKTYEYSYCMKNGVYMFQAIASNANFDYKLTITNADGTYTLAQRKGFDSYDFAFFSVPFFPFVNASISIENMVPEVLPVCNLSNEDGFVFQINNTGTLPIDSITITESQNGVVKTMKLNEYILAGNQSFYPMQNVTFIDQSVNRFTVKIDSLKAQIDEADTDDNMLELEFTPKQLPKTAVIEIYAVDMIGRYDWAVYDNEFNVLFAGNAFNNQGLFAEDLCLPTGCYSLFVNDAYGTGMSNQIGAKIKSASGKDLVIVPGDDFKDNNKFDFCIIESSVEDDSPKIMINSYPNPAFDFLNIELLTDSYSSTEIEIINTIGEVVYNTNSDLNYGLNNIKIPVNHLPNGIYMLKFNNKNNSTIHKFMINR